MPVTVSKSAVTASPKVELSVMGGGCTTAESQSRPWRVEMTYAGTKGVSNEYVEQPARHEILNLIIVAASLRGFRVLALVTVLLRSQTKQSKKLYIDLIPRYCHPTCQPNTRKFSPRGKFASHACRMIGILRLSKLLIESQSSIRRANKIVINELGRRSPGSEV